MREKTRDCRYDVCISVVIAHASSSPKPSKTNQRRALMPLRKAWPPPPRARRLIGQTRPHVRTAMTRAPLRSLSAPSKRRRHQKLSVTRSAIEAASGNQAMAAAPAADQEMGPAEPAAKRGGDGHNLDS